MTKVSIIIPAYNQGQLTIQCLRDVLLTTGVEYEVLLVDDGSTELVYKVLPKLFPGIQVLRQETNAGFVKSANIGLKAATGTHCLLLNNDVEIRDALWLKKLLGGMTRRNLDLASVAGGRMNEQSWEYLPGEATRETDAFTYLPGWCLLVRREVIERIGVLSEDYGVGFWDDADFSLRAKQAGFKLGIVEGVSIRHLYHQTFRAAGYNITEQYQHNREVFLRKWTGR